MGHHNRVHTAVVAALGLSLTALAACGGAKSDAAETAEGASAAGAIPICGLLTAEQVSTVLPNHDRGSQMASGPSLTKNVDNYQCSYTAVRGNDVDLLTVVVFVASDSAAFRFIKPNPSSKQDGFPIFREIKLGDVGMLYGKPGEIEVETSKGTTAVSLKLIAPGAETRADALVGLATVVASKVK